MEAVLLRGNPEFSDYTPSGANVDAGAVVVVGDTPRVAHRELVDGVKGSLAVRGGVYKCPKVAATVCNDGAKAYWDDTNNVLTPTASTHKVWGWFVDGGALAADTHANAIHEPGA